MTLNSCGDYSDKAGALSSNLQPSPLMPTLHMDQKTAPANDKLSIPIFATDIFRLTRISTVHINDREENKERNRK